MDRNVSARTIALAFAAALLAFLVIAAPCGARTMGGPAAALQSWELGRFAHPNHIRCDAAYTHASDRVVRLKYKGCVAAIGIAFAKQHARQYAAPALTLVSMAPLERVQLRVCESPMRDISPNIEMYAGLGCDGDQMQTTALDGFARMQYHIPLPR